jgi:hypothetical protein
MARFEGRSFRGERLPLEGHEYINGNFEDCVMVFSGSDGPMTMTGNRFGRGITWTFEGPAQRTLVFLNALYHGMGDGGREQVEEIFAAIRRARPR